MSDAEDVGYSWDSTDDELDDENSPRKRSASQDEIDVDTNTLLRPVDDTNNIYGRSHFGDFGEYMRRKRAKIQIQQAEDVGSRSEIFKGIAVYINGWTRPPEPELKEIIIKNGGTHVPFLDKKSLVTHVVASNLTNRKTVEYKHLKVARPEWILESVEQGRLLPWSDFIYRPDATLSALDASTSKHPVGLAGHGFKSDPRQGSPSSNRPPVEVNPADKNPIYTTDPPTAASAAHVPHYAAHASNPNAQRAMEDPNWRQAHTAVSDDFIKGYYKNSRLHHLSTWKAELRLLVQEAQERAENFANELSQREDSGGAEEQNSSELDAVSMRGTKLEIHSPSSKGKKLKPTDIDGRIIMHCDFDCFFVSAGLLSRPHLVGKPVVVCHSQGSQGGTSSTSEVASVSYEARKFGVKNGMSLQQARNLCADISTVPYEFELYKEISLKFYTILLSLADDLQTVSVDEVLIEVTDAIRNYRSPAGLDVAKEFAELVQTKVYEATGCSVSIGVSHNITLARIATRRAKPAGVFHLLPSDIPSFLEPLDVRDLPGFGPVAKQKCLDKLGTSNLGNLLSKSKSILCEALGKGTGETLYNAIRGIDHKPLESAKERKSVSTEVNYGIRFLNNEEAEKFVLQLSAEVARRLQVLDTLGRSITVKIMKRDPAAPQEAPKFMGHGLCQSFTKQTTLVAQGSRATSDAKIIGEHAWRLIKSLNFDPTDLRGIGIQIQKLESSHRAAGADKLEPGQLKLPFQKRDTTSIPSEPQQKSSPEEDSIIDQEHGSTPPKDRFLENFTPKLDSFFDERKGPIDTKRIAHSLAPRSRSSVSPNKSHIFEDPTDETENLPPIDFDFDDDYVAFPDLGNFSPSVLSDGGSEELDADWEPSFGNLESVEEVSNSPKDFSDASDSRSPSPVMIPKVPLVLEGVEDIIEPPKAFFRPQVVLRRQRGPGEDRMVQSTAEEVQDLIESWINAHFKWEPRDKDVEFFSKFLISSVDFEASGDYGIDTAMDVMKWWLFLLRRRWPLSERDSSTDEIGTAWWAAFRRVKNDMDNIVGKRFGGCLSLR